MKKTIFKRVPPQGKECGGGRQLISQQASQGLAKLSTGELFFLARDLTASLAGFSHGQFLLFQRGADSRMSNSKRESAGLTKHLNVQASIPRTLGLSGQGLVRTMLW